VRPALNDERFIRNFGGVSGWDPIDQDSAIEISIARIDPFKLMFLHQSFFLEYQWQRTHALSILQNYNEQQVRSIIKGHLYSVQLVDKRGCRYYDASLHSVRGLSSSIP
jgi:hypothetical protein